MPENNLVMQLRKGKAGRKGARNKWHRPKKAAAARKGFSYNEHIFPSEVPECVRHSLTVKHPHLCASEHVNTLLHTVDTLHSNSWCHN